MRRLLALLLTIITLWLSIPLLAAADLDTSQRATSGESSAYKAAVNSAIEEFRRGNFAEAREHFARAHALFPTARTLRGLGMSEFELRNYVEAVERLEQALASQDKPLDGTLREETAALLGRAKAYVGEILLQIDPSSARVQVDGFPVEVSAGQRIRLEVGDHVLEVTADGYLTERRALAVRGEQVIELRVKLSQPYANGPTKEEPSTLVAKSDGAPHDTPLYKRWWLWTGVGAVIAGGVIAGVLLSTKQTSSEDPYRGTTNDAIVVK